MSKQVEMNLTYFIELPDDATAIECNWPGTVDISYKSKSTGPDGLGNFMQCISRLVEVEGQRINFDDNEDFEDSDEYFYDQFNPHPYFTKNDWAHEVHDDSTNLGYAEWVAHGIAYTHGELTNAEAQLRFEGGHNTELTEYIDDLRLRLKQVPKDRDDSE